jgi:hypothetical protein
MMNIETLLFDATIGPLVVAWLVMLAVAVLAARIS